MKKLFSFLGAGSVLTLALLFSSAEATAQQATARVLRADINGNQVHMYLDHDSLQSVINRTMSAMDASEDGALLEWSDALTNGNNPGMNVNYNGFSVYGIDSLTSTGLLTADSLILHKDAEITGKLILGDSLAVAGAAAFTGDVKGPRSTGDDEFVTYAQLDSMASMAPFNETYKIFKNPGWTRQAFASSAAGTTTRMHLKNGTSNGYFTELSGPVDNPVDPTEPPYSIQSSPDHHMNLSDAGIYQFFLSIEFVNSGYADVFVVVEVVNNDDETPVDPIFGNPRVLSCASAEIPSTGWMSSLSTHLNTSMSFETDRDHEDIWVNVKVYSEYDGTGGEVEIETMSFSVSRIGEE